MDDGQMLALLSVHDEAGLDAVEARYGARLRGLAAGIVGQETAEECVNDALLAAWNAIPPERPAHLFAYLCRITRNLALNRYAALTARKRGGTVAAVSLDELVECLPSGADPARQVESRALAAAISRFLRGQPPRTRQVFLARYFYAMPLREIAERFALRENTVKTTLFRTRKKLRNFLELEEFL